MLRKFCNNSIIVVFIKLYLYKIVKLNVFIVKLNKRFVNVECLFFLYLYMNIVVCMSVLIINFYVVKLGIFEIVSIKNIVFVLNIVKCGFSIKFFFVNIC